MGITVSHALSMTTPDDPNYENKPSNWNSVHAVTLSLATNEVIKWVSAGTTSVSSGTVNFADSNGITWGIDTNGQITGTVQTVYAGTGFTSTTTAGTQVKATQNTAGLSMAVPAYLTTARASTAGAGLNTAQTNVTWTVNSSGISLNAAGYAGTATAITGNALLTLNSAGLSLDGSGLAGTSTGITGGSVTLNSSGIAINLPAYLTTAALSGDTSKYIENWKLSGNTAGTTSSAQGTDLWLAGGNGVTLSGSSNTISFSVATNYQSQGAYLTTARASNDAVGLNTAQTNVTWTVNSSGLSLNAGGYAGTGFTSTTTAGTAIVGTQNTAGLSLGVPLYQTIPPVTISSYEPFPLANLSTQTASGTVSAAGAFLLPLYGSFSFVRIPIFLTTATLSSFASNATFTSGGAFQYSTWNAVVYSFGTGANSQSLQSVASGSAGVTQSLSYSFSTANSAWSITQGITAPATGTTVGQTTQYSQTSVSANFSSGHLTNFSAIRWLDINFANSLTPGAYWLIAGVSSSSTTSGQGGANLTSGGFAPYDHHFFLSASNAAFAGMGDTIGSAFGGGFFATAGGGTTASVALSTITTKAGNLRPHFQFIRSA